jgi:hypothetical protein
MIACLASVWTLTAGSAAAATTYYAGPMGMATDACTQLDPCDIVTAVGNAADGDEVIILPGSYSLGAASAAINNAADVHGQDGQAKPVISNTSLLGGVFSVNNANASLRNLEVVSTGYYGVLLQQGTVDGVRAHATHDGGEGCAPKGNATIRDSVCWADGSLAEGVGFHGSGASFTTTLRNVTAVGAQYGIDFNAQSPGDALVVDAKSVISRETSGAGGSADVRADAGNATATVTVTLDHSNYSTRAEVGTGTPTVTDPGTGTNQTAAPLFIDPLNGDFHELSGSPTIDAGALDGSSGSTDIDGEARIQGSAPDIGADEFAPPAAGDGGGPTDMTTPATDTKPPITTLAKGPKKRTHKRTAKFQFVSNEPGSTFMCKLDKKAFAPCTAPKTIRVKPGRHTFKVEAVDPAGNVDPTPEVYRWKVLAG